MKAHTRNNDVQRAREKSYIKCEFKWILKRMFKMNCNSSISGSNANKYIIYSCIRTSKESKLMTKIQALISTAGRVDRFIG